MSVFAVCQRSSCLPEASLRRSGRQGSRRGFHRGSPEKRVQRYALSAEHASVSGIFFHHGAFFTGFRDTQGGDGGVHIIIYIFIGEDFPRRSSDGAAGVLCRPSGIALPLRRENCAAEAGELCHGGGNAVPLRCVLRTYPLMRFSEKNLSFRHRRVQAFV